MLFKRIDDKEKEQRVEEILCAKYNSYYRMAYSYTHNEADAADIVQEGAYRALRKCASLKNIEYAETWIYKIMLNEVYRQLGHKQDFSLEDETLPETGKEDTYEDVDLHQALEGMEEKDRRIIELRYFEDLQLDAIAEILDENVSTVKSRLYRGLKKLKVELMEV